jgi:hypothetical protein
MTEARNSDRSSMLLPLGPICALGQPSGVVGYFRNNPQAPWLNVESKS